MTRDELLSVVDAIRRLSARYEALPPAKRARAAPFARVIEQTALAGEALATALRAPGDLPDVDGWAGPLRDLVGLAERQLDALVGKAKQMPTDVN